ncbi:MAG: hypothetical protein ACRD5L_13395, partial [Bryobacteraceae bacterium]
SAVLRELRAKLARESDTFLRERLDGTDTLSPVDRERIHKLAEELLDKLVVSPVERQRDVRELRRRLANLESIRDLFGLDGERR